MERKGWIEPEWGRSERGRQAKFYSLTRDGRKQLADERQGWERVALAIGEILRDA
jgi:DNA-binding PadR family transcriptional regulator